MNLKLLTSRNSNRKTAFTLIEMLIVIGIILVLVAIVVPNYVNYLQRARYARTSVFLKGLKAAVANYHTDTTQWPPSGSEHLYVILSGLAPFSAQSSIRYKPPYDEFNVTDVAQAGFDTKYSSESTARLSLRTLSGGTTPLSIGEIQITPNYLSGLAYRPLLDPWSRPIIYISPDDLVRRYKGLGSAWDHLIAMSDEKAIIIGPNGTREERLVPYGLNSGQFYSTGKDGTTAETGFGSNLEGFFQPGNLTQDDRKDNDFDNFVDETDFKSGGPNTVPEDDINSWSF